VSLLGCSSAAKMQFPSINQRGEPLHALLHIGVVQGQVTFTPAETISVRRSPHAQSALARRLERSPR